MSDSEHAAYLNGPWFERKSVSNPQGYHLPATLQEAVTLRDQFAMAALTGILANPPVDMRGLHDYATDAYRFADEMLKAREEK